MRNVSIIIPYFKKRKFIKKTIDSIKLQTYKNFEVIIVYDDEDHSDLLFLKKIQSTDNRIRLIVNKKSLGAGKSRNVGISKAKGNIIAFLDADDLWKKNKIELQLNYMIKNNLEICHTSYEILNKKNIKKKIMKAKPFENYKQLLFSCDIGLSTVMLKKKIITKTCKFPSLKTKEDFALWLLILKKDIIIGSLDKNLTKWRKLDDSLSSSVFQKLKDGYTLYSDYMKYNFLKSLWYLFLLSINSLRK
ncbi:glycosyltransferase family 2 protein [Pelagibacterales bacterium SAG-MED09]|nr:glycosyltransferase family 2 protein [Pelagibacterales bacterium SAG-MED09]